MHSLIFHPSLIFSHHLSPLSLFPHIPKRKGTGKEEPNSVSLLKKHLGVLSPPVEGQWCHLCARTTAWCNRIRQTCVRDGQTKMEHPIVALPEEAGLEGFSGWVSFPGFCRWKQGLKVVTPLCRQGHRGPEWIPSDSFLPGIRPADSFFLVSASDNFLILKEFPNSGTLCRHLKTGLMEAIQLYIYWICNLHHSGHCGPEQQAWQDLLEGGRWWMSISSAQEGWCALPEWTCSISVALPWELQNIPLNQCSGVAD